jgi:hypothetical protein
MDTNTADREKLGRNPKLMGMRYGHENLTSKKSKYYTKKP